MAFMKKINDLLGLLTMVVLTLPSIAANIDCNGRPFHCVNSTHFMICVDLGSGVSSTIDDFVIPCPPTTVCQGTNKFECEFPAVTTVTPAPLEPSVSEMLGVDTTSVYNATTSIPFEEYYDTVRTTTLSGDVLLTQLEIVTESILPETDDINVISVSKSNSHLNETIASIDVVQNYTSTKPLLNNIDSTVTEVTTNMNKITVLDMNSTLSGTIENIDGVHNDTLTLTTLPNNIDITVTEVTTDANTISVSEINSTLSGTIARVDVAKNDSTPLPPLHNTMSVTVTEVNLSFSEGVNVPVTESNYTLSDTVANVDVIENENTSLKPLPNNIETAFTEVTADIPQIDVVHNDAPALTPLHNTMSVTVTEVNLGFTEDVNVTLTETDYTWSGTNASVDVKQNETTSPTPLPNNQTTTVTEFTTDLNESTVSDMNSTLSVTIANVDAVHNDTSTLTPLSNNIDTTVTEVTTDANKISVYEIYSTLSGTIASIDAAQNDSIPLTPLHNTLSVTVTEVNLGFSEDVNVPVTESNNTLSETIASVDVIENKTTSLTPLPNNIETAVTEVTADVKKITVSEINSTLRETIANVHEDTTTLTPLHNTMNVTVTEVNLGFTEDVNVPVAESDYTWSGTILSLDVIQNKTTSLKPLPDSKETTVTEVTADGNEIIVAQTNSTLSGTITSVDVNQKDITTQTPFFIHNMDTTATEVMPVYTEDVNVNKTIASVNFVQNDTSTFISSNTSMTETTEVKHTELLGSELKSTLSETIPSVDFVQNGLKPLYILSSTTKRYNLAEMITESIVSEAKEAIPSVLIDVVQDNLTSFNVPSNTALSNNTEGIVTEAIISDVTENINLVNPRSNPNKLIINDNVVHIGQTTTYTAGSASLPIDLNHEPNTSLDEPKPSVDFENKYSTTINALRSTAIDLDVIVTEVTESIPVATTESVSISTLSNPVSNVGEYITTLFTPSSDNLPNNDIVTDSVVIDGIEDPKLDTLFTSVTIPNAADDTVQNDKTAPIEVNQPTIQEPTTLIITDENKIESVTADNMLLGAPVTKSYKSITTESYKNNEINLYTTEATLIAEITTASNQGFTTESIIGINKEITTKNNDILEITPNSILNITALPQAIESSTYGNIYYHTDTENIASDLTNPTDGKPIHGENVLSTGIIDATTQVLVATDDKFIISTPVPVTVTSMPNPVITETTPSLDTNIVIMTRPEPTISVTDQKSNIQEDITLGLETNYNIRLQLEKLERNTKLFQRVNISSSEVLVASLESTPTTENPNESVYLNASDQFMINTSADTTTEPTLNNNILFAIRNFPAESSTVFSSDITESENIKAGINTEQNTLATVYTVTGTSQAVLSSEPSHIVYALKGSTTISPYSIPDILQNQNTTNAINNTMTSILNGTITRVTSFATATDSLNRLEVSKPTSENYQSIKEVTGINVDSIVIASGNEIINHLSPTVLKSEIFTENTTVTAENNIENTSNSTTTSTFKEETTVKTKNNTATDPGFYATTEIIAAGVVNQSNELPLHKVIDTSKSDNISGVIQITMSSLTEENLQSNIESISASIPDIKAHAPVLEGFNVDSVASESANLVNTPQKGISKTITQGLVTISPRSELTVQDFDRITPTFTTGVAENSVTATESYSKVNEVSTTVTVVHENTIRTLINYEEETRVNNPILNLLLNSVAIQTPNKEPTNLNTWDYIPATSTDVLKVSEKSNSYTSTPAVAYDSSTQHDKYTQPAIGLNIELIPKPENHLNGLYNQNNDYGQPIDISTSEIKNPDVQTITPPATSPNDRGKIVTFNRGTSQSNQVFNQGEGDQLSIVTVEVSPREIITETQTTAMPEIAKTMSAILSQEQHQKSMANNGGINTLQNQRNIGFQQTSTPPITDLENKQNNDSHTQGSLVNTGNVHKGIFDKATTAGTKNEGTIRSLVTDLAQSAETNILKSTSQVSEATIKPSQDNMIDTQRSQGVSIGSPIKSPQKTPSPFAKQDSNQKNTVTEPWRATVVTKPTVSITTPIIAENPVIDVTTAEPDTKSWNQILPNSEITARPNLNTVISNPVLEFNVARVTIPNTKIEQPSIDITSSVLSTESWNMIPKTSIGAFNGLIFSSVSASPEVELFNLQKNYVTSQTNVQSIGQKTDNVTTPILVSNLPDTGVVLVDSIKPVIPILGENAGGSTHSGISVIPKSPRKSEQNEQLEGSESVEKPESKERKERPDKAKDIKERKETGENLEALGNHKGEKPRVTPAIGPTNIKSYLGFENNENTVASIFTISVKSDSTVEMTTRKTEENLDTGYQSISNIEQVSSPVRSAHVSPEDKDKSVQYESIVTLNVSSTSNDKHSKARNTPQTKSSFANTHNTPVPAFESSTTKTRNFVCKPNKRGRFSDNTDCRKFYICIGKLESIEGTCPNNTVFSELRKQCTKNLSHCVRNNQFQCVSEGRFSDYLNDNFYYICVKNNVGTFIRFKLQCQSGYHLSKTSVRCVLNTEQSQSTSQQSTSDISKDSNQSVSSAQSEKLIQEPSKANKFECEKEGKFSDANNCRKYYICTKIGKSKYRQKSKKCDSDELFHKDKKKCVDADSYECS